MSQVSFQMDFEIPAELINVYAQLTAAPFIGSTMVTYLLVWRSHER